MWCEIFCAMNCGAIMNRTENILQFSQSYGSPEDALYGAIVDETCELARREVDRIAGDLGVGPREVCCSLILALLKRMEQEGENPYDTLDWAFDALGLLAKMKPLGTYVKSDQ